MLIHLPYEVVEEYLGTYSFTSLTPNQKYIFHISFQLANENDGFEFIPAIRNVLFIVTFKTIPTIIDIKIIRDPRIAVTILHYFELALNNGYILNYLCSDLGNFERHRKLIFNRWFQSFERKDLFHKIDYDLKSIKTGKVTYIGFIIKKSNPLFKEFMNSIDNEIDLYRNNK